MKRRSLFTFLLALTLMLAMTLTTHASSISMPDADGNFTFSLTNGQAVTCLKKLKMPSGGRIKTNIIFDLHTDERASYTITVKGPNFPAAGKIFTSNNYSSWGATFDGTAQGGEYTFTLTPASNTAITGHGKVWLYTYE